MDISKYGGGHSFVYKEIEETTDEAAIVFKAADDNLHEAVR